MKEKTMEIFVLILSLVVIGLCIFTFLQQDKITELDQKENLLLKSMEEQIKINAATNNILKAHQDFIIEAHGKKPNYEAVSYE